MLSAHFRLTAPVSTLPSSPAPRPQLHFSCCAADTSYSTSFLATALPAHGRIDTIEYSPQHAKVAQANFLDMNLCPFPTMHVGKALDLLRDPKGAFASPPGTEEGLPVDERGYDLVFVDANKDEYFEYFMEGLRLARKGGVLVFDNAVRGGR